ncbi:MAG: MarR family transcriptional regulator, partial [Clostridia bacterium]|nr:MarR family transcriptional regulator [Clostridia bacterium]
MSKTTNDLAQLIVAVYPNVRRVFRHLVSLKDAPISMTQLTCLSIIEKQGKLTMSALAKRLSMSNQQLTKVVDTLESFELVVRNIDEANHRQIFVQASRK